MDKKLLIHLFGSQAAIGKVCGVGRSTVNEWDHVPLKHHKVIKQKLRARVKFLEKKIHEADKQIFNSKLRGKK